MQESQELNTLELIRSNIASPENDETEKRLENTLQFISSFQERAKETTDYLDFFINVQEELDARIERGEVHVLNSDGIQYVIWGESLKIAARNEGLVGVEKLIDISYHAALVGRLADEVLTRRLETEELSYAARWRGGAGSTHTFIHEVENDIAYSALIDYYKALSPDENIQKKHLAQLEKADRTSSDEYFVASRDARFAQICIEMDRIKEWSDVVYQGRYDYKNEPDPQRSDDYTERLLPLITDPKNPNFIRYGFMCYEPLNKAHFNLEMDVSDGKILSPKFNKDQLNNMVEVAYKKVCDKIKE